MFSLCTECQGHIDALNDEEVLAFVDQLEKDLFEDDEQSIDEDLPNDSFGQSNSSSNSDMSMSTPQNSPLMDRLTQSRLSLTRSTASMTQTTPVPHPTPQDTSSTLPCTPSTKSTDVK